MATSFNEIVPEALVLAAEARAKLAETLLESLQEPLSEVETVWAQKVERVPAFDCGETPAYAAEDFFAVAVEEATVRALAFPLAGLPAHRSRRRSYWQWHTQNR